MPELPEVETIKEAMRKAVDGAKIEAVSINNFHLRDDIPANFEKIVCNAYIKRIYRIAKYALMDLDNGYSIVWHFGMSGKIRIVKEGKPTLEKHDHVILSTTKGIIIYNDPRRFGMVTAIKIDKIHKHPIFSKLGLDPFDDKLTVLYLKNKFSHKNIPIKSTLLEQSIISGIGNIYASEALFEARISPLRSSVSLKNKELELLIKAIRFVLSKAIQAGGSTLHDYRQPDGSTGYFQLQHCVYGKEGQRCPNCICKNKGIQKIVQNGRSTYYCPHLQK